MASVQSRVQPTKSTGGAVVPRGPEVASTGSAVRPLPGAARRAEPGAARGRRPIGPAGRRDGVRPGVRGARRDGVVAGRATPAPAAGSALRVPEEGHLWADDPAEAYAPLRLTRRGRRVGGALLVLIGLAIVALAAAMTLGGGGDGGLRLAGSTTVVVEQGDTLWSIAGEIAPDAERRAVVDAIADLNHLSAGQVRAGQVLRLP